MSLFPNPNILIQIQTTTEKAYDRDNYPQHEQYDDRTHYDDKNADNSVAVCGIPYVADKVAK